MARAHGARGADLRLVRLDGEALFNVTRDSRRPFLVRTRNAAARALGTQLNVYERPDGATRVAVIDGVVEVTPLAGSVALRLSAGEAGEVHGGYSAVGARDSGAQPAAQQRPG